ncbi:hypothetical protein IMSHALPRED_006453 [Imshaugia aleurites]|uniref:Uncharacterized protein n=1 Tax=Imshaugia aleurites TaxID=172621 RepID=A0A8H3FP62_9LECA|nr:hypothetical protein IMSHALPRED_006453 [Imshaugia aleurites]
MVNLQIVGAASANATNTTFTHRLGLAIGPFGLQELESTSSFLPRNGRSWTVSIRTSDIVALIFTILALTFAIDHYLFKSRYLVHIGGATRAKDHAAVLDEKASLYEKEARNVEAGRKCSSDEDSDLKRKSAQNSESSASTTRSRLGHRIINSLFILFLFLISGGKTGKALASTNHEEALESSSAKAEAEGEVDKSTPTSRWGTFVQHPWVQWVVKSAILCLGLLALLAVLAFHLLFWPLLFTVFILLQCLFHEQLNDGVTVPWKSIALRSTSQLAIWTIIGVTLLLKPNRFQGMLWKCQKWTHAVSWWLFWVPFESYYLSSSIAKRVGFPYSVTVLEAFTFIMRPSLVVYLYSGVLGDVVVAVRLCKYFWKHDVTNR